MNAQIVAGFNLVKEWLTRSINLGSKGLSIQQTLRYIEWTMLILVAVYAVFSDVSVGGVPSSLSFLPFLLSWFALSFIFPVDRPLWQRRLYILVEIALVLIALVFGWNIDIPLYLFIAKACFLLNRRDVVITVTLAGICWHTSLLWSVPQTVDYARSHLADLLDPKKRLIVVLVNNIIAYIVSTTFVVLISFATLAEQKSQQRAEQLAEEVQTLGVMLERERIARDIHDTLGHTLTALGVQLEVAQQIGASNFEQALQRLEMAKQLADQCLQEVRQVVQTMRESNFDLAQALTALITQIEQSASEHSRSHPRTQVQLNLPTLPLQTGYQIYCIVQEGVTNIQKYADATQVKLRGWAIDDHLFIELADNGNGFDPAQHSPGFGLQGMQERVQLLGGTLQIQTAPNQGTKLLVQIPLPPLSVLTPIDPEVSQ